VRGRQGQARIRRLLLPDTGTRYYCVILLCMRGLGVEEFVGECFIMSTFSSSVCLHVCTHTHNSRVEKEKEKKNQVRSPVVPSLQKVSLEDYMRLSPTSRGMRRKKHKQ